MKMDSSYLPSTARYLKVPLIALNIILWLLGLVLLIIGGVGVAFFSKFKEFADLAPETIKESLGVSIPAGILCIGIFFMILTVVGCVVAYKERMVGLVFYTVLMLVLLVVLVGIGGESLTYHNYDDAIQEIGDNWFNISSNKNNSETIKKLESFLECCQFNSTDPHIEICPIDPKTGNYSYVGSYCENVVYDEIQSKLYLVGSAGVAIGVIELVCMLFALFLIIRLYRKNRNQYNY